MIVLDVLKLHKPSIIDFSNEINTCQKGLSINIRVIEMDERTETIQLIIMGNNLKYKKIKEAIEVMGASVHSIDEVCMGSELICSGEFMQ